MNQLIDDRNWRGNGTSSTRLAAPAAFGGLREDFALRKILIASFAANALFLEIIRLAYNLVVAFQSMCLPEAWTHHTLHTLRYKLFWLPGELTRPQNRPVLRLLQSANVDKLTEHILNKVGKLKHKPLSKWLKVR